MAEITRIACTGKRMSDNAGRGGLCVRPYTFDRRPPCGQHGTGMEENAPLQEEPRYE
jgi:hypothetical protein